VKALVTGANGFLGFHVVKALVRQGYEVTGMTRNEDLRLSGLEVKQVHGDVRNFEQVTVACKDQDVVFHTAASSGIWGPWKLYHGVNTIGTKNVIEACRENGVGRLVYTSSPSVTFAGDHQINQDESAAYPKQWLCHYPYSKALAEKSVLEANEQGRLLTCALRPHLIWGPGDRHLIPRLLKRAKSGQLRRVGDGRNQVDTIFVTNAADAHLQAAEAMDNESPVAGSAYFLSQDDPVNLWGWINDILQLAGVSRVKRSISYYWAHRLGYALETAAQITGSEKEPRMTRFLAAQLAKSHYFDISRAKTDFDYRPKVSNSEGMKRLAKSMQKA
jgi:nucleoside-diphosphate-sugar epimerase